MRKLLLVGWLMLPIGAWAYHEGPGQDRVDFEAADAVLVAAHAAFDAGDFAGAVEKYEAAIGKLPTGEGVVDPALNYRLQLELNKARMKASLLPEARDALQTLVEQLDADTKADPGLVREARQALARSQFYKTWLMRLEGLDREAWEPEIEAARQNYRLLAEQSKDPKQVAEHQGDLEAAIRLARLDIEDLQGLPLPGE